MRLLLVDDDPGLRALLRTTFEAVAVEMEEASSAEGALAAVRDSHPDAIVLDVHMPGIDGLELCRQLKSEPETEGIGVVLLTGSVYGGEAEADAAGADALVHKPFSPLELLTLVERVAGGLRPRPYQTGTKRDDAGQLLLYARDLRHLLELERGQRRLLQDAYKETVLALASALESKDTGTRAHSQRVQRYALELARGVSSDLAGNPSAEYGFLLHDVGKIGIPDSILQKPAPLSEGEARLMKTHTVLGEQMLGGVAFLQGEGLEVVRSHHERWDGEGYPDGLAGTDIPLAARVFAVADALDAMTSDRPYRVSRSWASAGREIAGEAGGQFDPDVVVAFRDREGRLREIRREFAAA